MRVMKFVDVKLEVGGGYTGIDGGYKNPSNLAPGYTIAINPITGKTAWKMPLDEFAVSAGTLATDGGLLFTGKLTGEFIALDQDSGKQLWQFKTGSSVNAPPMQNPVTPTLEALRLRNCAAPRMSCEAASPKSSAVIRWCASSASSVDLPRYRSGTSAV